jgi:hypothetical protein
MKPNVIISIEHNSWYCECCGGISDISVNTMVTLIIMN